MLLRHDTVSTASQLVSLDFENDGYFRGPDLIFDGLRETSIMVFVLIHLMFYCEWGFWRTSLFGRG